MKDESVIKTIISAFIFISMVFLLLMMFSCKEDDTEHYQLTIDYHYTGNAVIGTEVNGQSLTTYNTEDTTIVITLPSTIKVTMFHSGHGSLGCTLYLDDQHIGGKILLDQTELNKFEYEQTIQPIHRK